MMGVEETKEEKQSTRGLVGEDFVWVERCRKERNGVAR